MNKVKKIECWCYEKDEPIIKCPICNQPILYGTIGIMKDVAYHYLCIEEVLNNDK